MEMVIDLWMQHQVSNRKVTGYNFLMYQRKWVINCVVRYVDESLDL